MLLKSSLYPFRRKDAWQGQRTIYKGSIGNKQNFSKVSHSLFQLEMDSEGHCSLTTVALGLGRAPPRKAYYCPTTSFSHLPATSGRDAGRAV